ncbi:MAG TPA: prephenate dehydrogenase [Bryobacteraceae bacterium]|nr:prephenate dehydrogenase [Bryobacteraceae bacterium]
MHTVAIVGVGLIGGSFGLALKKAGFRGEIVGVSSPAALAEARRRGAIDRGAPLADAARDADLIYLAQPIGRIMDTLRRIDDLATGGALITDAGSTKSAIVALARKVVTRCQFLGGHPMAGKEKRGASEADAGLFAGRAYVLTPDSAKDLKTPRAVEFVKWIERIGAVPVVLGPDQHDLVVSFTSHLPQLASTALAATVAENLESREDLEVAGPGLMDMTRLAKSSYEIWRDILATNSDSIDRALAAYIARLEHLRENLRTRRMQHEFEAGAALATRLRRSVH